MSECHCEHGYSRYTHGCRCDECRAAKATYMREKRAEARRYAKQLISEKGRFAAPIERHGIASGYRDHKCRCLECTAAYSAAQRREPAYRARLKPRRVA